MAVPSPKPWLWRLQVLAALRKELFRTLLMQRIEFFDRHEAGELTALLSIELDTLRTFVFKCGPHPQPE